MHARNRFGQKEIRCRRKRNGPESPQWELENRSGNSGTAVGIRRSRQMGTLRFSLSSRALCGILAHHPSILEAHLRSVEQNPGGNFTINGSALPLWQLGSTLDVNWSVRPYANPSLASVFQLASMPIGPGEAWATTRHLQLSRGGLTPTMKTAEKQSQLTHFL